MTDFSSPTLDAVREIADALCRAGSDCYHQHGRSARLIEKAPVGAEERGMERLCAVCDETLEKLAAAYEQQAASFRPDGTDDAWWHSANALWLASREYARRHRSCDAQTRGIASLHSPSELETLHLEFEFEASALLALRQSCEAYGRARPQAL
jgi:hypothetical protein